MWSELTALAPRWRQLLLWYVVLPLRQLSSIAMTPCGPLQVSRTPSVLWTIDPNLRAFHSPHGPHFTPQWMTSLLGSPQLPFQRERDTKTEHIHRSGSTFLWLPPQSAVTVWEPTLIEFELAWKTQQTVIRMFAFEKNPPWCRGLERSHVSVSAEYGASSRFCIVSFRRSISAQADCRVRLFVYRALSPLSASQMHPSVGRRYPPPLPTYQFTQFTKSRLSYLLNKY